MLLLFPLLLPGDLSPSLFLSSSQHQFRSGAVSFLSFVPLLVSSSLSLLFSSFFYSCPPSSLLISSIFFINFLLTISLFFILFLFEASSLLSTSSDEAEVRETLKTSLRDAGQFTYLYYGGNCCLDSLPVYIGSLEPLFVRCNDSSY